MCRLFHHLSKGLAMLTLAVLLPISSPSHACGGFFCQTVPIDQAGEQIIFRKDGEFITATVRILYEGDAEDFSWVVPVPDTPELSTGSDATFDELESLTRPIFDLTTSGSSCQEDFLVDSPSFAAVAESALESTTDSVVIEQQLSVGPFDVEIISSDDANAMADWLVANDYDLSDRGVELLTPYVEEGMKFVALKLRSGQTSGSIQPLIMRYRSDKPVVPIRLTAVAAQDDMGVIVWVVGDSRAVPENYLHVIPNYTRLNWYAGRFNAFASYQSLITDAMDEAGGQGFATDYAATINSDITAFLTNEEFYTSQLTFINSRANDADALVDLFNLGFRSDAFLDAFMRILPLPAGQDTFSYQSPQALQVLFSAEELESARAEILQALNDIEIEPLRETLAQLPEGEYMTRLYTTLSADEMTLDPEFDFNPDMADQGLTRQATMNISCTDDGTQWSLTLGAGTGRDGERVIEADGSVPFAVPEPITIQNPVFVTQRTSAVTMPELQDQNSFATAVIDRSGNLMNAEDFINGVTSSTEGTDSDGTDTNGSDPDNPVTTDIVESLADSDSDSGGFFGSFSMFFIVIGLLFNLHRRRVVIHA